MDTEKVIKRLENCLHYKGHCLDCPYNSPNCQNDVLNDAVTLLKEQEAVEPTLIREGRNKYYSYYVCPRCGDEVVYDDNYCSECGVRFLWEGR